MSKEKRQKRFEQKKRHIERQFDVWSKRNTYGPKNSLTYLQPHRLHKMKAFDCGDSNCVMCGNPRRFFGEVTQQEKKFYAEPIEYE